MTWIVVFLLTAISCTVNGSGDCSILAQIFNLTQNNGNKPIATPTPLTAIEKPTPNSDSNRTTITPVSTGTVNPGNGEYLIGPFARLYSTLRTHHENELRKVQARYDQLEEYFKHELDEVHRKYYTLEVTIRKSKSVCETDCLSGNSRNSSIDRNFLYKVEQFYQHISTLTDGNAQLLHNVKQISDKLSSLIDVTNTNTTNTVVSYGGSQNCSTNKDGDDDVIIAPPTTIRVKKCTYKRYLGCYQDRQERRLLKEFVIHSKFNSVDTCIDSCLTGNYIYAGLEGQWCRCDNKMRYTNINDFKLSESSCNIKCSINRTQSCGGTRYAFSLYETGFGGDIMDC